MKIDGQKIAREILNKLSSQVANLKIRGVMPTLAIILIGKNPASVSYVEQKEIKGEIVGAKIIKVNLPSIVLEEELLKTIDDLNDDKSIHGIIVQRPLPAQINEHKIDQAVLGTKDVDGFRKDSKFKSPVVLAINEILQRVESDFKNKRIAVVGKGQTGGAPVIKWLIKLGAYVNVIDSGTDEKEKQEILKNSDIVISAVGKPQIITGQLIKKGAILISIGLHKNKDGKMEGDYIDADVAKVASFYTSTPGGVGPINVAYLFSNLLIASKAAESKETNNGN